MTLQLQPKMHPGWQSTEEVDVVQKSGMESMKKGCKKLSLF